IMLARVALTGLAVWHLHPFAFAGSVIHFVLAMDPFWGIIPSFMLACIVFPIQWYYEGRREQ
ncbi:MAG: hypothetical protein Q7R73_03015, partial [bacterium]|nr:hypothetical protein [bacterium]